MKKDILKNKELDTEKNEKSDKIFKKLASETGKFYNDFLDILIKSKSISNQQKSIEKLINSLPIHMQKLYKKGVENFFDQVRENHKILEKHKNEENKFLMKEFVRQKITNIKKDDLVKRFDDFYTELSTLEQDSEYFEIIPGIPVLKIRKEIFDTFYGSEKYSGELIITPELIFFVTTKNFDYYLDMKHELNHLIFNFLKRSCYLRQEKQLDIYGFERFREEIVGYILSERFKDGDFVLNILLQAPEKFYGVLVGTKNKDILKKIRTISIFISKLIITGHTLNIKMYDFIYPCLISRNFEELLNNCKRLIPKDEHIAL